MTFITRAAWGARRPNSTGNAIGAHPLGVAVHYSEGNLGSSPDSLCDDKVRGIQNYHMDAKGWADIAYSFLVCPHGNIFEGRGTGKGSAANGTTAANRDYYAVCALGGPKDTPSVLMLAGIGDAIGLCRKAGAALKVIGHRDLFPTACPGSALYAFVKAGRWAKLVVKVKAAVVRVVTRAGSSPVRGPFPLPVGAGYGIGGHVGAGREQYAVKEIQTLLRGIAPGIAIDGSYGPTTAKWVGYWTKAHGPYPTTVVNKQVWDFMSHYQGK